MKTAVLDPKISEFETNEQANHYDVWFRSKVQEALDDKRPRISHEHVVQKIESLLASLRQEK